MNLNVDKVFCITLNTSTKRQKNFIKRFSELINSPIFEWFIIDRDNENPERGCYTSHQKVLNLAKQRNYNKIITFEDDADLLVPWTIFVNNVNDINYPNDWKIVQLGYFPFTTRLTEDKQLVKINCSGTGTCYISNVKKLVIPKYSGIQIDVLLFCPDKGNNFILMQQLDGIYGIRPILIRPRSTDSTINMNDILHQNSGNNEFDRNTVLEISTKFNLLLFVIIIGIFIIVGIIFGIGIGIHKIS
jgi:hypothetical protein